MCLFAETCLLQETSLYTKSIRHMKIKKPKVHFIMKILLKENESKTSYGYVCFLSKTFFIIKWTFSISCGEIRFLCTLHEKAYSACRIALSFRKSSVLIRIKPKVCKCVFGILERIEKGTCFHNL